MTDNINIITKPIEIPVSEAIIRRGTARLGVDQSIGIHINAELPIILDVNTKITLGRLPVTNNGLDLTPFDGYEKGVSRIHAELYRSDGMTLMVVDMNSPNGTYLNGIRLIPKQPRIVRDGDEIRLGELAVFISFR